MLVTLEILVHTQLRLYEQCFSPCKVFPVSTCHGSIMNIIMACNTLQACVCCYSSIDPASVHYVLRSLFTLVLTFLLIFFFAAMCRSMRCILSVCFGKAVHEAAHIARLTNFRLFLKKYTSSDYPSAQSEII